MFSAPTCICSMRPSRPDSALRLLANMADELFTGATLTPLLASGVILTGKDIICSCHDPLLLFYASLLFSLVLGIFSARVGSLRVS